MTRKEVTWACEWQGDTAKKKWCCMMEDGVPSGFFKAYDECGNVSESGMMLKGLRSGVWTEYFADGQVKAVKNYANGLLDGERTVFLLGGTLAGVEHWERGRKVGYNSLLPLATERRITIGD